MGDDAARDAALTYARKLAAEVIQLDAWSADNVTFETITLPFASTTALAESWESGKQAAKIRWGTDGAMKRCIRLAREYMRDPGGYCAERHKGATGQWPTEGGKSGIES